MELETYLYCRRYVESLIMPFFLNCREKAYCASHQPIQSRKQCSEYRWAASRIVGALDVLECRHEDQLHDP